jgi:hypothetical protein
MNDKVTVMGRGRRTPYTIRTRYNFSRLTQHHRPYVTMTMTFPDRITTTTTTISQLRNTTFHLAFHSTLSLPLSLSFSFFSLHGCIISHPLALCTFKGFKEIQIRLDSCFCTITSTLNAITYISLSSQHIAPAPKILCSIIHPIWH